MSIEIPGKSFLNMSFTNIRFHPGDKSHWLSVKLFVNPIHFIISMLAVGTSREVPGAPVNISDKYIP